MFPLTYSRPPVIYFLFFFFNDTATTEIYTLSLHDALPISVLDLDEELTVGGARRRRRHAEIRREVLSAESRSEEHTSELQSQSNLVCRLLLEKKKKNNTIPGCAIRHHTNNHPLSMLLHTTT